jgi:hypothetical protein
MPLKAGKQPKSIDGINFMINHLINGLDCGIVFSVKRLLKTQAEACGYKEILRRIARLK